MKRLILPSLCLAAASLCSAGATMKASPGITGISYSRIESRDLDDAELKSLRMMATVNVSSNASNVTTTAGRPAMAITRHTVCFGTFLTTEADYIFVLDVGGQQTIVRDHIVIPARQRTCVTKQLYKQIVFPSKGNYTYSGTTTGYTMSTGKKQVRSNATIFVN